MRGRVWSAAPAKNRPCIKYRKEIYLGELFELRLNEVLPPEAAQHVDRFGTANTGEVRPREHLGGHVLEDVTEV